MKKENKINTSNRKCRIFNQKWEKHYFFTHLNKKCVCLICNETVALIKEYNIRRHYNTKHSNFDNYTREKREQQFNKLKCILPIKILNNLIPLDNLIKQQNILLRPNVLQFNSTIASYEIAKLIVENSKTFSDGEFIKKCINKIIDIICPEKLPEINCVSLSRSTIVRRIEELSINIKKTNFKKS